MKRCLLFLSLTLPALAACASSQTATPDIAQIAQATLYLIGTRLAAEETLTITAVWPTSTSIPTFTPTSTATPLPTHTPTITATPLPTGYVKTPGSLRVGPGKVYPVILALVGAEEGQLLGQTQMGDWLLIRLGDGTEGWLPASSFESDDPTQVLPVITDLPPTPTLPPPPPTATPTATFTPFPFACNVYVTNAAAPGQIVFIGNNWPPNISIQIAEVSLHGEYSVVTGTVPQSDATGAFQYVISDRPGSTRNFRVFIDGCSRSLTFP